MKLKHKGINNSSFRKGDNLLALFGLPLNCNVLIIGSGLNEWRNEFLNAEFYRSHPAIASLQNVYHLILFDTRGIKSSKSFCEILIKCKLILSPKGTLVLFAYNFWSFSNLKGIAKGRGKTGLQHMLCGYACFKKFLKKARFFNIQDYMCFPSLDSIEEFVKTDSEFVEIPHYYHLLQKIAKKTGIYKYVHNGFAFVSTKEAIEKNSLLSSIHARLSQTLHAKNFDLRLIRFDIRSRGALVLFVRDNITKKQFITRVVPDGPANKIISKNQSFLKYLHSNKNIPFRISSKIPLPVEAFKINKNYIYVESLLPGVLAWKVNGKRLKNQIYNSAVDFIFQLNCLTRTKVTLNMELLDKLFSEDLELLNSSKAIDLKFRVELEKIIDILKGHFLGKEICLLCSHGDYGYGNILINPANGNLTAVIDWDTGRKLDFPGIDFLNMKIQNIRSVTNSNFNIAFEKLALSMLFESTIDDGYYNISLFNVDKKTFRMLIIVCALRYILRSLQYPKIFNEEQQDYRKVISYLSKVYQYE